jgi:putative flippase GtrA
VADAASERRLTLSSLRDHPAPRYVIAGSLTFLVDIGSLKVLHGSLGVPLVPATALAFLVAFVVNFTASRHWTFARTGKARQTHQQLMRYLVLVGINLCSTIVIVAGFSAFGVNYLIAKVVAGCLNALGNYYAYRHWIFAAPPIL